MTSTILSSGPSTYIVSRIGRAVIAKDVEPAPVRDFLKDKLALEA